MTIDGTDFRINYAQNNPLYYSHKFKSSAYQYEVAVCIKTREIVWILGPHKAGLMPDITIFRKDLKRMLCEDKQVKADNRYIGKFPDTVWCPQGFANESYNNTEA